MSSRPPVLILCAHGTRDPAGAATVRRIARSVARQRPDLDVVAAYVDIQSPSIGEVVARVDQSGRSAVVVPLLLCTGYHVEVDLAAAIAHRNAVATPPLGPDESLADVLVERLLLAGANRGDGVVVAAAGSSRSTAADDAEATAALVASRWDGPVVAGYGASADPLVGDAVASLSTSAPRVAVASYLIGRGHFHRQLRASGAPIVTAPLGDHAAIIELVVRRYDAGRARLSDAA